MSSRSTLGVVLQGLLLGVLLNMVLLGLLLGLVLLVAVLLGVLVRCIYVQQSMTGNLRMTGLLVHGLFPDFLG